MKQACRVALKQENVLDALSSALCILEDCEYTNAGLGSNLNIEGQVECDALIMSGLDHSFGAVGACQGIRNPSLVATQLLKDAQTKTTLSLGRLRPLMLTGKGAWMYAKQHKYLICAQTEAELDGYLVTDDARGKWQNYKTSIDQLVDTVGAITVDQQGHVYAGVSSGGIAMKHIGRIGEAAMFGAGCWADNSQRFGCSCSGTGESIMLSMLAKNCADQLKYQEDDSLDQVLTQRIQAVPSLCPDVPSNYAGVIAVQGKDFAWAHNTPSFAVGYYSSGMQDAVGFISKQSSEEISVGMVKLVY